MAVVDLKCPNCGGMLHFDSAREIGYCEYCGNKIMIQDEITNIVNNYSTNIVNNYVSKPSTNQSIYPILCEGHYEGEKDEDGKPHGKGMYFWPTGVRYEGEFVHGVIEGKGVKTYPAGVYTGEFKNNLREGTGEFVLSNGGSYKGSWKDDIREGYGKYVWPDGSEYEGDWVNEKRTGHGKYKWPNGDWYEGEFLNGKCHGKGVYHNHTKLLMSTYKVKYENGKFIGKRLF